MVDFATIPYFFPPCLLPSVSNSGCNRASYVKQSLTSCPKVPIVMSGWSQGAQVVHKAAHLVGPELMGSVSSVVTFGDPGAWLELVSFQN